MAEQVVLVTIIYYNVVILALNSLGAIEINLAVYFGRLKTRPADKTAPFVIDTVAQHGNSFADKFRKVSLRNFTLNRVELFNAPVFYRLDNLPLQFICGGIRLARVGKKSRNL